MITNRKNQILIGGIAAWGLLSLMAMTAPIAAIKVIAGLIGGIIYFILYAWILARRIRSDGFSRTVVVSLLLLTILPFLVLVPHLILLGGLKDKVLRGGKMVDSKTLQRQLAQRQNTVQRPQYPLIEIGGVHLTNDLENLGFFFVGSPGSGKTQAIKKVLSLLRDRPDYRVMILDRNGELTENFYDEYRDHLYNPQDKRSVDWIHTNEDTEPETLAASLIPDAQSDENQFFTEAARSLMADLLERCQGNSDIWKALSQMSNDELKDLVKGGISTRIFDGGKMTASVLATMTNGLRFYKELGDTGSFSFRDWGREDRTEWLFLPIFEDSAEKFKPLYSMAFELVLRGMLSNENRLMKTAIVIDELGALNKLNSLNRLISEGRKFKASPFIGTQTDAQIEKIYGEHDTRILMQGCATKLILNCRDSGTAERFASLIGKQERIDITRSTGYQGLATTVTKNEQIREIFLVMPTELQALPPMQGYLTIADGTSPARVGLTGQGYPLMAERLIRKR